MCWSITVSDTCECHYHGTKSCSNLNGLCECKAGYTGFDCKTCAEFYAEKNDPGICEGQYF